MTGITEHKISIVTLDDPVQHKIADELAQSIQRKRHNFKQITELVTDPRRARGFYDFGDDERKLHELATTAVRLEAECRTLAGCANAAGVDSSLVHHLWNGTSVTRASQIDD